MGGNEPPVCAIEYQGEVMTLQKISVAITPPTTAVELSGCSSFDPDGGPITFLWQACPGTSFSDPTACDTVLMIPTPPGSSGQCDVRLLVTDSGGITTATNCRIFVEYFENTEPTCVLAEEFITVYAKASDTSVTVTLDACASFDPDPQTLTFDWDGCPASSFSDQFACKTEMTIDLTGQTLPLTCGARLFLSDGVVTTQQCRTIVTVLPRPDLDICPFGCPTPLGKTQTGTVRSVLTANAYFDASLVDTNTLVMRRTDGVGGSVQFFAAALMDAATPVESDSCDACPIVAPDGFDDRILLSDAVTMVNAFLIANEPNGTVLEIEVTGELLDGTPFSAQDCVTVGP
ncbi:MAG TPA: hypothetical protein VMT18_00920 [Planctomycetota bacterium]|nr:hypothetical protein [Planctomycetota bacterium]